MGIAPLRLVVCVLVLVAGVASTDAKAKEWTTFKDCSSCVTAGHGWSVKKQRCGMYANTLCPDLVSAPDLEAALAAQIRTIHREFNPRGRAGKLGGEEALVTAMVERFKGQEQQVTQQLKEKTGEYSYVKNFISYHLANPPPPPTKDIVKEIYKIFDQAGVPKEAADKKLLTFSGKEENLLWMVRKHSLARELLKN